MSTKIYVDKNGSILTRFSPYEWAEWINSFVESRDYLITQKKFSPQKELKYMVNLLEKRRRGL